MAATSCEDLVKQTHSMQICSSRHVPGESQNHLNAGTNSHGTSSQQSLNLSIFPATPPSLKGIARFQHYELIWKIMQSLKEGSGSRVEFRNHISKYRAIQDVMEILFFENVIEDLLVESGFYSHYIYLHSHELLVTIMAYDFQKYKCLFRPPRSSEGIAETMFRIAVALWDYRVKLNANWSRMRVTACAQSSIQLLPLKKLEQLYAICTAPLYCRVIRSTANNNIYTRSSLTTELFKLGIDVVDGLNQLGGRLSAAVLEEGLIVLSAECRQCIYDSSIKQGPLMLFPQDPGSLVSISKLSSWFKSLRQQKKKDVIITNCDKSGAIASHISSLIGNDESKVFIFEVPPVKMKTLEDIFQSMMVKNIQMIPAQFEHVDPADELFANVGIIVCNPPSSLSTVHQPIDFIMQEGEENISQLLLKTQSINFTTLEREQAEILSSAMRFKHVEHIAYFTRSIYERENKELVKKVLTEHTAEVNESDDYEWAGFELEFDSTTINKDSSHGFLCTFKPAPPKPPPPASEVISKAIKLGILNPIGSECLESYVPTSPTRVKKKSNKKRIFSQHNGIPLTFSAKQKVVQKVKKKEVTQHRQSKPFL